MDVTPKNAPMSSAPFVYNEDGSVAWDKMWTTFCAMAKDGGPSHRGTMLESKGERNDVNSENYKKAAEEIITAISKVAGYTAWDNRDGWIGVKLSTKHMAKWFAETITLENVRCRAEGRSIFLPVNDDFTLKEEIKNVVTVIAKSTDYWRFHKSDISKIFVHLFGKDISAKRSHE